MDGNLVTGEPSQSDDISMSFAEMFDKLCPKYMAMGMSYNEFWHSNTTMHKACREARDLKRRDEEWARWRQGAYIYDALLRVAPVMRAALSKERVEPGKYPEEPWPLTEKEAAEQERRREEENFKVYLAQMEASSARELERRKKVEVSENA